MRALSLTGRLKACVTVRDWQWWQLPVLPRCYVAAVPVLAIAVIASDAARTDWRASDLVKFAVLLCCITISVVSTPRLMYASAEMTPDLTGTWIVPAAILLPPVYAALLPVPMVALIWWFLHRGVPHRTVFSAAAVSLEFGLISWVFRAFPASFAGATVGTGWHALTWVFAVMVSYLLGRELEHFLVVVAVKLTDPSVRIRDTQWTGQELQVLFAEVSVGALLTLTMALRPQLIFIALPLVLLMGRFLAYPLLMAQSRVDAKTGLLNAAAWEAEAEAELSRAARARQPLSVALADIDHFKGVNDTYGHLVGDRVLKALGNALTTQSRGYDRVGRFGGEEFVLLLPQTAEADAAKIAERLRGFVEDMAIRVDERPDTPVVKVTISIGVAAMKKGESRDLADLVAAADSALYKAKQAGRNRVATAATALEAAVSGNPPQAAVLQPQAGLNRSGAH
jgi:diguanylate cyclase (GGDEF)-like protein